MDISERTVGDVTVVDVSGKIVMGEGDTILKDKVRSLAQQGRKKVVMNLGGVSYVDSAGLGALVQGYATIKNQGGTMKLVNVAKRLKDLLTITKLSTVFETFDSEDAAVKSF
jgi:anti-sigma B factor antagonist